MPRPPTLSRVNRSRCDTCGYASTIKPGRACPECGGTMLETDDGFRRPGPTPFRRTWTSWVALVVLIAMVGMPLYYFISGLFR